MADGRCSKNVRLSFTSFCLGILYKVNRKDAICVGRACRIFCPSVSPSTQIFRYRFVCKIQRLISSLKFSRQLDVPSYRYTLQSDAQHLVHTWAFPFTQIYYKFVEIRCGGDLTKNVQGILILRSLNKCGD